MTKLSGPQLRRLKAQAQRLDPILKIGKAGVTDPFLAALDDALNHHELVKIKFDQRKEEKRSLTPVILERSRSLLVLQVGNVVVLHRPKTTAADIPGGGTSTSPTAEL
jgi:RNA-binding protein